MEASVVIAIALRPVLTPILFFACVATIAWLLFRLFPQGRLKVVLFRDRTGPNATPRDKRLMILATITAYVAFFAWIGFLSEVPR